MVDVEAISDDCEAIFYTDHEPTAQQRKAARYYWLMNDYKPSLIEVFPGIIEGYDETTDTKLPSQLYDAYTGEFIIPSDKFASIPYCCEIHFVGTGKLYEFDSPEDAPLNAIVGD